MKKMTLTVLCIMLTVVLAGCSTIKGVGQDLSTVGGWVTKGSDNVREGR